MHRAARLESPALISTGEKIINRNRYSGILIALLALALVFAVGGCGDEKTTGDDGADVNSQGLDAAGCEPAEQPEVKQLNVSKPTEKLDPDKTHTATFQTNCGEFAIELDVENNPKTAANFAHLVEEGAYDDTWFHRIIAGFVIQGGDPKGDGTGGVDYTVREKPSGSYEIGTVAMAKTGQDPAGTSGSQFYIVIGEQGTSLPPDYAIAGKVVSGQDTLDRIALYAAGPEDQSGTATGVALVSKATLSSE